MSAMDVTGVLVLGFATIWASVELGWSLASEAARAMRESEATRVRPSAIPERRW